MKIADKDKYDIGGRERSEVCTLAGFITDPKANIDKATLPSGRIQWGNQGEFESAACDYYRFFSDFFVLIKNFLKEGKENRVFSYLAMLAHDEPMETYHFINNVKNDGYIYLFTDYFAFDESEYSQFKPIGYYYCHYYSSEDPYLGHEKSLAKLFEKNREYQEKYKKNDSIYLKYTPKQIIKEVIDCYDENVSEIAVNSFAYRSSFFQNLRNQVEFYRKMIEGLTDDWNKDREYLRNYDFNIPEVKEAIPPTDDELEELVKKYSVISEDSFYFGIESYRDGEKIEDAFHFEAEGKYSLKVKISKPGDYALLSEMFGKEGLITQELARFTVSKCIKEPVYFKNEYDLPVKFNEYFEAACDLPDNYIDSMIIPGASLGFASLKLERLSD
jgi:hypothetical protein